MGRREPRSSFGIRFARIALAGLVTAGLGLSTTPVTATAGAPFGFMGVSAEEVFWQSDAEQNQNLAAMRANGITELRQIIRWSNIEPAHGALDWHLYDRILVAAARHGMRVLPIIGGEVPWATSRPPGDTRNCLFWQVWNEANTKTFWGCKRNAVAYMKLAKAAANAIHEVDPDASIITTGAPVKHHGDFLRKMFEHGAKGVFDAIALHPYKKDADAVLAEVRQARELVDDLGAKKWKLHVTEFGWATSGPPEKPHTTDEARQGRLVKNTLTKLAAQRDKLKLTGVDYYQWRDVDPLGGHDYWGLHTGLLRLDGSPKPALNAVVKASRAIK